VSASPASYSDRLIQTTLKLRRQLGSLSFTAPVAHVYSPLYYAWEPHRRYLESYGSNRKRVLFVGMNPGPFGMVQTGIPFGEIKAVRDWMRISGLVNQPPGQHPRRPILGFECKRTEISGARLWGLFARRYPNAPDFFSEQFVLNYCPLAFLSTSGSNLTPDKLLRSEREAMEEICSRHLKTFISILAPEIAIGIGGFAAAHLRKVTSELGIRVEQILHPSPACPASNDDWAGKVERHLRKLGVWTF